MSSQDLPEYACATSVQPPMEINLDSSARKTVPRSLPRRSIISPIWQYRRGIVFTALGNMAALNIRVLYHEA